MQEKVVFTNGCFDILHAGHIDLLRRARELGTKLIVGINSDRSVRAIKGAERPLVSENDRVAVLRGVRFVDEVRVFDAPTPEKLIEEISPDVLVKGGDWKTDEIIGADFVLKNGGKVFSMPLLAGYSTSRIISRSGNNSLAGISENDIDGEPGGLQNDITDFWLTSIAQHQAVFEKLRSEHLAIIKHCAYLIWETFAAGKKVLICGNGGSAADPQHRAI